MIRKIVGVLGFSGTPKFADYFCSKACYAGLQDSESLCDEDYAEIWVTPRSRVLCAECGKRVFDLTRGIRGELGKEQGRI